MSTSNTSDLSPVATDGEEATATITTQNTKPITWLYRTRNAPRRALADIRNFTTTKMANTKSYREKNNGAKASGMEESNKFATGKTANSNYNDSIANRARGKRRRATAAVDENTRNNLRQRIERIVLAKDKQTLNVIHETAPEEIAYAESLSLPEAVLDIDASDSGNHLAESKIAIPVMRSMHMLEKTSCAIAGFMHIQGEVSTHHRRILIDWLVDVHDTFRMTPPTLFLTVNLIDRFLGQKGVVKRRLQLVCVGCMLVVSKYEEIYYPSLEDFVYIGAGSFTRDELIGIEALILNVLDFRVTVATPLPFVSRTLKAAAAFDAEPHVELLAHYALELALCDYNSLNYNPSHLAAAAVYFGSRGSLSWGETMCFHSSGYTAEMLTNCAAFLHNLVADDRQAMSTRLNAVRRKYSKEEHGRIALLADGFKSEVEMTECQL